MINYHGLNNVLRYSCLNVNNTNKISDFMLSGFSWEKMNRQQILYIMSGRGDYYHEKNKDDFRERSWHYNVSFQKWRPYKWGLYIFICFLCLFWDLSFLLFVFDLFRYVRLFVILYTIYYIIFVLFVLYYNPLEACLFSNETPKEIQRGGVVVRNWEKHREREL